MSKALNIRLYNKTWFDKPPRKCQPLFHYIYPTLALPKPQLAVFTSLSDLHVETKKKSPSSLIEKSDTDIISPPYQIAFIERIVYIWWFIIYPLHL